jgi:Apg6 BARA domain
MEPFRPSAGDTGIQDGDVSSSIRSTVSLLDDDDDDDDEDGSINDVETDHNNIGVTYDLNDAERRSIPASPPSQPPPPPPSDVLSFSELPVVEITENSQSHPMDAINDEERIQQLRHRLLQIYQERRKFHTRQMQCDDLLQELQITHNIRQHEQQRLLTEYMRYKGGTNDTASGPNDASTATSHAITLSQYWNVTASDAFMIVLEHGNTIASINGLRLGAIVTLTIPPSQRHHTTPNSNQTTITAGGTTTTTATATPTHSNGSHIQSAVTESTTSSSSASLRTTTTVKLQPPLPTAMTVTATKYKIPWAEINAALGQVAILITTMEQNLQRYDHAPNTKHLSSQGLLFKHEFICMGSTSKIGVRKSTSSNTAGATLNNINFYNLFYTEENTIFHMLLNTKKRNFDIALQLLLGCVSDVCKIIHDRDRTVYIPYDMNIKQWTIADIPITYFSGSTNNDTTNTTNVHEHAEQWTRAMKYLLSNVKHALSYRGIGLWNVVTANDTTPTTAATGTGLE